MWLECLVEPFVMNWRKIILAVLVGCTVFTACEKAKSASDDVPNVVTADIQVGIEKHIEEQTKLGDGYFKMLFNDEMTQSQTGACSHRISCQSRTATTLCLR